MSDLAKTGFPKLRPGRPRGRTEPARIAELESLLALSARALSDGFHTGFCDRPCRTCDQYRKALEATKEYR